MKRTLIASGIAALLFAGFGQAGEKDVLRIGIPRSAFRDVPPALLSFAGQPFKDLIKAQTGLKGDVANEADWTSVAKKLDEGKLHLGVFQGHEFAWARQKYPGLEAIVCSVPRPKDVQAFLLVRYDCKAESLGELKGGKLAIAKGLRDHAGLFLEKEKAREFKGEGFASVEKTSTVHEAIHTVMDGDADVTIVDSSSWSYFQKLYPGPCQNMRVLAQSEVFPAGTIVYKKGTLDSATIKAIRDGLTMAHKNPKGSRMMNLIRIERFDAVSTSYNGLLKACLKCYPKPDDGK